MRGPLIGDGVTGPGISLLVSSLSGFGTKFTLPYASEGSHPPTISRCASFNRVLVIPVLLTRVLIGRFRKPPLLPCLDRIAHRALCTHEDVDAELFE